MPGDALSQLEYVADAEFEPLLASLESRAAVATLREIAEANFFDYPKPFVERVIKLYVEAPSVQKADLRAKSAISVTSELSRDQTTRLLEGSAANEHVRSSSKFKDVLKSIKRSGLMDEPSLEALLEELELSEFMAPKGQ